MSPNKLPPSEAIDALVNEIRALEAAGLNRDNVARAIIARELRAKHGWTASRIARALRQPVERINRLLELPPHV